MKAVSGITSGSLSEVPPHNRGQHPENACIKEEKDPIAKPRRFRQTETIHETIAPSKIGLRDGLSVVWKYVTDEWPARAAPETASRQDFRDVAGESARAAAFPLFAAHLALQGAAAHRIIGSRRGLFRPTPSLPDMRVPWKGRAGNFLDVNCRARGRLAFCPQRSMPSRPARRPRDTRSGPMPWRTGNRN